MAGNPSGGSGGLLGSLGLRDRVTQLQRQCFRLVINYHLRTHTHTCVCFYEWMYRPEKLMSAVCVCVSTDKCAGRSLMSACLPQSLLHLIFHFRVSLNLEFPFQLSWQPVSPRDLLLSPLQYRDVDIHCQAWFLMKILGFVTQGNSVSCLHNKNVTHRAVSVP